MNIEPLRELGLTEGEIKVYLALTELGESTSGPIVKRAGVSISKVYTLLDKLVKRGLVSHIVKNNTKYFSAAHPDRLLYYLKQKEDLLKQQEKSLKETVAELAGKQGAALTSEIVQVYEGLKGIQTARERTLSVMKKDDEMWIIGIARTPYEKLTPYFEEYHK